jgi:5-formyltetrahydrofolate cyclo-ligase
MMLERRSLLTSRQVSEASISAQQLCLEHPLYASARSVALYSPISNEIATDVLMNESLGRGVAVYFPVVLEDRLVFRRVHGVADLVCGKFGICEPLASCEPASPDAIDLFFVPGVAFDLSGRRIGFGKGFYDRSLHSLEGSGRLVGLCHDFQIVESIAGAPHDVQMDILITDLRVIIPRGHFT